MATPKMSNNILALAQEMGAKLKALSSSLGLKLSKTEADAAYLAKTGKAVSASVSDKATADGDGNVISSTYATKDAGVYYIEGTGDTAGIWLGSHSGITAYYDGLMIAYKPSIAGATGLTLNINNLGAVSVVRNATSAITTHYAANSVVFLVYTTDGSTAYWKVSDYDSDTKTRSSNKTGTKMYIIGASTQSTSGQTTYSNSNCYIGTDNKLYSGGKKVTTDNELGTLASKSTVGKTELASEIKLGRLV